MLQHPCALRSWYRYCAEQHGHIADNIRSQSIIQIYWHGLEKVYLAVVCVRITQQSKQCHSGLGRSNYSLPILRIFGMTWCKAGAVSALYQINTHPLHVESHVVKCIVVENLDGASASSSALLQLAGTHASPYKQ